VVDLECIFGLLQKLPEVDLHFLILYK
jgi:hypothetical protein